MKIRLKLVVALLLIAALVGAVGFLSLNNLRSVGTSFDSLQYGTTPALACLSSMNASVQFLIFEAKELSAGTFEEHSSSEEHTEALEGGGAIEVFGEAKAKLVEATAKYLALQTATGGLAESIDSRVEKVDALADEIIELKEDHISHEVLVETLEEFKHEAEELSRTIDLEINNQQRVLRESESNVNMEIQVASQLTIFFTTVALSLALGMGGFISRSIYKPLMKLRNAANEITKGNLDAKISSSGTDEIGELALRFDIMRQSVQETNANLNHLVELRTNELETVNEELKKANEELTLKDKLKDEFINIASHELRTPVQPIISFVDLGRKGYITYEEAFDKIAKNAKRLQRLANDILDVTRIETGQLSYSMMKVSINDLIESVENSARATLNGEVSLITRLASDVQIDADPSRLTQALSNIIGNAVKFTKRGTIKVESHILSDNNMLEIKISDTAGGIPSDILPKLFGKFVTQSIGGDTSHGTGLGLYISRAIVVAHGGEISAYNNSEGGATFTILLPIKNCSGNDSESQKQTSILRVSDIDSSKVSRVPSHH